MWTKLKARLSKSLIKKYAGSIIRHGISWAGGALAVMTIPALADLGSLILANIDSIESTALAIVTGVIALLMSFKEKKGK
jgi:hypothetical protein